MVRIVRIGSSRQAREASHNRIHRGPVLLQDYKHGDSLPTTLQILYELPAVKNSFQAVCVVLHNMMLESGFCSLSTPNMQHPLDISDALSFSTVSLEYNHFIAKHLILILNCNVLGPYVVVNGLVQRCKRMKEQILTLQIISTDFVKKFNADSKPIKEKTVYKNMSKLSHQFRERIVYKTFDIMRAENKLAPHEGLLSLEPQILLRIFSNLDSSSLCAVSTTCKQLRETADGDILWRALCTNEFGTVILKKNASWKRAYKKRWERKKKEEKVTKEKELANSKSNLYPSLPKYYPIQEPKPNPIPEVQNGVLNGGYNIKPQLPYGPFGVVNPGVVPLQNPYFTPQYRPQIYGAGNVFPGVRFDQILPNVNRLQYAPAVTIKPNRTPLPPHVNPQNSGVTQRGWVGSFNGYYYA